MRTTVVPLLACATLADAAFADDGSALFEKHCALCHRPQSATRAPVRDALSLYVASGDPRRARNRHNEVASGCDHSWPAPPKPACLGKPVCSVAQMAPVTAIPGVVFSGSMDGHLRAFGATDGQVIWDLDTQREFDTVNGVKAQGGSLNATGPVISAGMLYLCSGYGQLGGMPGNALLAFAP